MKKEGLGKIQLALGIIFAILIPIALYFVVNGILWGGYDYYHEAQNHINSAFSEENSVSISGDYEAFMVLNQRMHETMTIQIIIGALILEFLSVMFILQGLVHTSKN